MDGKTLKRRDATSSPLAYKRRIERKKQLSDGENNDYRNLEL